MGRRLPWKTSDPDLPVKIESPHTPKSKPPSPPPPSSRLQRVVHSSPDRIRSPSTSPPPEPPEEQFMTPSDDRYRMVEDEFLHVARRFTTHLHRAEYNRLKCLAQSHNAAAIRAIERPVAGPPTRVSKHRTDALRRASRQGSLTGDESPPWMSTGLRGLMESPRKEARTIRTYALTDKGTRAAAGFGSRVGESLAWRGAGDNVSHAGRLVSDRRDGSDETDDDLVGPSSPSLAGVHAPAKTTAAVRANTFQTAQTSFRPQKAINRAKSEPDLKRSLRPGGSSRVALNDEDNGGGGDDDPFGIKRRKVRRAKSREQVQKSAEKPPRTTSPDLIPSFL